MYMSEGGGGGWEDGIQEYGPLQLDPCAQVLNYGQSIFEGMKAQRTPEGEVVLFRPEENARRKSPIAASASAWSRARSTCTHAGLDWSAKASAMVLCIVSDEETVAYLSSAFPIIAVLNWAPFFNFLVGLDGDSVKVSQKRYVFVVISARWPPSR